MFHARPKNQTEPSAARSWSRVDNRELVSKELQKRATVIEMRYTIDLPDGKYSTPEFRGQVFLVRRGIATVLATAKHNLCTERNRHNLWEICSQDQNLISADETVGELVLPLPNPGWELDRALDETRLCDGVWNYAWDIYLGCLDCKAH